MCPDSHNRTIQSWEYVSFPEALCTGDSQSLSNTRYIACLQAAVEPIRSKTTDRLKYSQLERPSQQCSGPIMKGTK